MSFEKNEKKLVVGLFQIFLTKPSETSIFQKQFIVPIHYKRFALVDTFLRIVI